MVILDGLKYACETCIKGHRSSACSHTDRTLFEIKKKGRPITQCEHCRHLRKTRQVHVKCLCGSRPTNDKSNVSRARLKLPTSATIRIDPTDPSHATITAGLLPPPKTKIKTTKSKPKPTETKSCSTRPSSPSLPSAPVTPPPPSTGPTTSSCCSAKSHPPDNSTSSSTTASGSTSSDKYTASLLDDLSRGVSSSASTIASTSNNPYHHHVQPFYNPSLSATSFAWQSGVNLGSCSCGITCACPGCYEHSPSTSMILLSGENCPYSCTTCTACNGFGFTTASSHPSNTFFVPTHPNDDHWRQPSSSALVSTNPIVSTSPSFTSPTIEKSTAVTCCGGPCKCIVCNCDKVKDGDEPPERIGFAVSGERRGCCTDENPRVGYRPPPPDDASSAATASDNSHDGDNDLYHVKDRPAPLYMQGNPTTTPNQTHSIDLPKLIA